MCVLMNSSASGAPSFRAANSAAERARAGSRTKRLSSPRMARTSSYRVTNQSCVVPSIPGWQKTGSFARIRANVSYVAVRNPSLYRSYFRAVAIESHLGHHRRPSQVQSSSAAAHSEYCSFGRIASPDRNSDIQLSVGFEHRMDDREMWVIATVEPDPDLGGRGARVLRAEERSAAATPSGDIREHSPTQANCRRGNDIHASSRRMTSSVSSFRPCAKPRSTPTRVKPHFSRTRMEPALSLAARAYSGRVVSILVRNSFSARVAIPWPQYCRPIQYVTSR